MKEVVERELEALKSQQRQAENNLIALNSVVAFANHLLEQIDKAEKENAPEEVSQPESV